MAEASSATGTAGGADALGVERVAPAVGGRVHRGRLLVADRPRLAGGAGDVGAVDHQVPAVEVGHGGGDGGAGRSSRRTRARRRRRVRGSPPRSAAWVRHAAGRSARSGAGPASRSWRDEEVALGVDRRARRRRARSSPRTAWARPTARARTPRWRRTRRLGSLNFWRSRSWDHALRTAVGGSCDNPTHARQPRERAPSTRSIAPISRASPGPRRRSTATPPSAAPGRPRGALLDPGLVAAGALDPEHPPAPGLPGRRQQHLRAPVRRDAAAAPASPSRATAGRSARCSPRRPVASCSAGRWRS